MGFFPTNTTESAARSGNQYTTNFNNPKFNSHGYSHVCHQAISGEVYVCPIRTKFRTSIAQQSTFKAPHSNPPLPPHSHLSLPASIICSSSARRLLERDNARCEHIAAIDAASENQHLQVVFCQQNPAFILQINAGITKHTADSHQLFVVYLHYRKGN